MTTATKADQAIAGRGLRGDRYCRQEGAGNPDQEVTLIEREALEALAREHGIRLEPAQSRRLEKRSNGPI